MTDYLDPDSNGDLTAMGIPRFLLMTRRLRRDRRAATAVEFAMIGVAFFFMIFSLFTVAIDMFIQMTLDDATRSAARHVQVWGVNGTATTGSGAAPSFVDTLCSEFGVVAVNCAGSLQYSVQVAPSFGQMTTVTLNSSGNLSSANQYGTWVSGSFTSNTILPTSEGTPEFLLVQVAYPLPFKLLGLANAVAAENGTNSLYSAAATVIP
jgi:Flp pilus assembly protein TadG